MFFSNRASARTVFDRQRLRKQASLVGALHNLASRMPRRDVRCHCRVRKLPHRRFKLAPVSKPITPFIAHRRAPREIGLRECLILARLHVAGCVISSDVALHNDYRLPSQSFSFAPAQAPHRKDRRNSKMSAAVLSLEAPCLNRKTFAVMTASLRSTWRSTIKSSPMVPRAIAM